MDRLIRKINYRGAVFDVIEKSETIYAGKIILADSLTDQRDLAALVTEKEANKILAKVKECVEPKRDIVISINHWKIGVELHGLVFARETKSKDQIDGIDVYVMPPSLFIRAYTDKSTAKLFKKDKCEIWELFDYIKRRIMPGFGFKIAENGAQEIESFDTKEHRTGYAYVPVFIDSEN